MVTTQGLTSIIILFFALLNLASHPVLDRKVVDIPSLASLGEDLTKKFERTVGMHLGSVEELSVRHLLLLPLDSSYLVQSAVTYLRQVGLGVGLHPDEVVRLEKIDFGPGPYYYPRDFMDLPFTAGPFLHLTIHDRKLLTKIYKVRTLRALSEWTLEDLVEFSNQASISLYRLIAKLREANFEFRRRSKPLQPTRAFEPTPMPNMETLKRVSPRLVDALEDNKSLSPSTFFWDLWDLNEEPEDGSQPLIHNKRWLIDRLNMRHEAYTLAEVLAVWPQMTEKEQKYINKTFLERSHMAFSLFLTAIDRAIHPRAPTTVLVPNQCNALVKVLE